jgi:cytochrome c oxidase assembly factor CtaG
MSQVTLLALHSGAGEWSFPPWSSLALILIAVVYVRGWNRLHRLMPGTFTAFRPAAFLAGLTALWLAIASPVAAFDDDMLTIHMLQHLLLMVVSPPLVLLGAPLLPLLHGLPRVSARRALGPLFRSRKLRAVGHAVTHPAFCWAAWVAAMWGWHVPAAFEFALRSEIWHQAEHAAFFSTSLLFWWPVVQPWPSRPHWPEWSLPLYLLLGDIANTVLCACLVFSDRILYPSYAARPQLFSMTALQDQVTAGCLMWVIGSFAILGAAAMITVRLLSPARAPAQALRSP